MLRRIIFHTMLIITSCGGIFIFTLSFGWLFVEIIASTYGKFADGEFNIKNMGLDIIGIIFAIIISELAGLDASDDPDNNIWLSISWAALIVSLATVPSILLNSANASASQKKIIDAFKSGNIAGLEGKNLIYCIGEAISGNNNPQYDNTLYTILTLLIFFVIVAARRFFLYRNTSEKLNLFTPNNSAISLLFVTLFLSTYLILNHTEKINCNQESNQGHLHLITQLYVFTLILFGAGFFLAKFFIVKEIKKYARSKLFFISLASYLTFTYLTLFVLGKIAEAIFNSEKTTYLKVIFDTLVEFKNSIVGVFLLLFRILMFVFEQIKALLIFIYNYAMGYPAHSNDLLFAFVIMGIVLIFLAFRSNSSSQSMGKTGENTLWKILQGVTLIILIAGFLSYRDHNRPTLPFTNVRVTCDERHAKKTAFLHNNIANLEFGHCTISWPIDEGKCNSRSIIAVDYNNTSTPELMKTRIENIGKEIKNSFQKACSDSIDIPTLFVLKLKPEGKNNRTTTNLSNHFEIFISDIKSDSRSIKELIGTQEEFGRYEGWEIIDLSKDIY